MKGFVFTAHKHEAPHLPAEEGNAFPPFPHNFISKRPPWPEGSTAKSKGIIYPLFLWTMGFSAENSKDGGQ